MGQKVYESDKFLKTGGTGSQYLMANGTTSTGPAAGVDGTGTANKVAKFSDSDTITDSTITDDGTDVSITGKLGIQTAAPDSIIHIEHEDNNYDVARGIHLDYTKDHTGTGWSASVFGVRATVTHEGTGKTTDVTAGRFQALHEGTGTAYFLYGSSSRGTHNGSGNTGVIWGAFNSGQLTGTGTGTHPFLIGTNQKAELNNANATVANMAGIISAAKTTAGTVTGRIDGAWLELDCNQGAATTVDANVLYLKSDIGNLTVSGTARSIHSASTLPSLFLGTIEAPRFFIGSEDNYLWNNFSEQVELFGDAGILIETSDGAQIDVSDVVVVNTEVEATSLKRTGGTSSQFLKADGTVDSSTYSTTDTQPLTTEEVQDIVGAMVNSNTEQSISVTYSDGDGKLNFDAGAATYTHPGETAFTAAVDTGALTGAVVVSDIDMNITTNAFGHVSDAAMAVATRTLTLADLGFTGDVDATNDQTLPTDFVSKAGGGTFSGDIIADSFAVPGGSSSRFLKADGSTDSTAYNSGIGLSGGVAIYDGSNTTTDDANLQFNFLSSTLTVRNLDVSVDLEVGGDVDVTGGIECASITTDNYINIPQTFQANMVHSSGNGYMNLPFNSLSDASSGGEQHFIVTPYQGYVHSVAFKNTATGSSMTGTNMNWRVLRNGTTIHTSSSQSFTAAARTYKGWVLGSTDATFSAGNDLRFQFRCTSGFWYDTCAVVVLKCII